MESADTISGGLLDAQGFVLVGGRSLRMGSDKAQIRFRGTLLMDIVATSLERVCSPVMLVARSDQDWPGVQWPVVHDLRPDCGPLGAIETALTYATAEYIFVVGCDMPLVDPALLRELYVRRTSGVVVPVDSRGKAHPLCSLWNRETVTEVKSAVDARRLALTRFLEESTLVVSYLRLDECSFPDSVVTNVNTELDLEALQTS